MGRPRRVALGGYVYHMLNRANGRVRIFRKDADYAAFEQILSAWPVARPRHWVELVNQPQTDAEVERLRMCVQRGRPYGNEAWTAQAAQKLGLETTLRPRGRPRKVKEEEYKGPDADLTPLICPESGVQLVALIGIPSASAYFRYSFAFTALRM